MIIENDKLLLHGLSLEALEQVPNELPYDCSQLELGPPVKRAILMKIDKMKALDCKFHLLYTYFLIVNKDTNQAMGMIGFKGMEAGMMEVGYGISKCFEGRGHMTTSLQLLSEWAFLNTFCHTITAFGVLKSNYGSQRVLEKSGFCQVDEDQDGLAYIKKNPYLTAGKDQGHDYQYRKTVYVVLPKGDTYGVVQVRDRAFLVGGGVEACDEEMTDALRREVLEETGYDLELTGYLTTVKDYQFLNQKHAFFIDADVYHGKLTDQLMAPKEKDHELVWLSKDKILKKLIVPCQQLVMNKYLKGDLYGVC